MVAQVNEVGRLNALKRLNLLDTCPTENFDRITRTASLLFGLPIAAVSLTDPDRQWFKSRFGFDEGSVPRVTAPSSTVAERAASMVIPDLLADPVYRDSPLAQHGVRFYAGAPLVTEQGFGLGAICVMGCETRTCSPEELSCLSDLAAMVMAQIDLQHVLDNTDPVSGLPNRTQFCADLKDLARDSVRDSESHYLVLVDIAKDEQLHDAVGVMGSGYIDDLVIEAREKITGAIGPTRKAYHVAPTQIAFLAAPAMTEQSYLALLATTLSELRSSAASRFVTTTTIGVAPFLLGAVAPVDLLRRANSAAQDGRKLDAPVRLYSAARDEDRRRRFTLVNDFGSALTAPEQLRLAYQPRLDVPTGACVGAEALLRWDHPTLGPVSPAEFIPLIEHTSLARDATAWVLDAALRQQAIWRADGVSLVLSVNVSAANLDEADFAERLAQGLSRHGVQASSLELEVTESAMMHDPGRAMALLAEIAAMGVTLAIDDFGTGYSSLFYLQQLPAGVVKIDQSFMRDLARDTRAHALVKTMIDLSHALGHRVVAEGVEDQEAQSLLAAAGCDEVQGYLFAEPMAPADFVTWLSHRASPALLTIAA